MEKTIQINRKLVIAFLVAVILYLTFSLYQDLNAKANWFPILLQVLLIGMFIWGIFAQHLKKMNEPFNISPLRVIVFLGLVVLLIITTQVI